MDSAGNNTVEALLKAERSARDKILKARQEREKIIRQTLEVARNEMETERKNREQRRRKEEMEVKKRVDDDIRRMEAKMAKELENFKSAASKRHKEVVDLLINAVITV